MKGRVSAELIFKLMVVIIIVIGILYFMSYLLGKMNVKASIDAQYSHIEEVEDKAKDLRETGGEIVSYPFKLEPYTKCIWFNQSEKALMVLFKTASNPVLIKVESYWDIGLEKSKAKLNTPGHIYKLRITPSVISCEDCFEEGCED